MGFVVLTSPLHRLVRRILLVPLLLTAPAVQASRGFMPLPGADGEFHSSQWSGNRGPYEVRHWLVVDPDPEGTHCRSLDDHQSLALLAYGDLVVTDTPERGLQQAVVKVGGRPWLRMRLPNWRLSDYQQRMNADFTASFVCLVRANARYLAPVNDADLLEFEEKGRQGRR